MCLRRFAWNCADLIEIVLRVLCDFLLILYFCLHLYFYGVSIEHNTNAYRKFYGVRFVIDHIGI
ncbi:hypothetical protein HMPREF1578_00735 [Gardnerella pickettii JCP8017B]|nr:hypothetical protein HMPREF1578_00735 [Gardnerella pickettii JCP8017B]